MRRMGRHFDYTTNCFPTGCQLWSKLRDGSRLHLCLSPEAVDEGHTPSTFDLAPKTAAGTGIVRCTVNFVILASVNICEDSNEFPTFRCRFCA
jgi:hypothetical protein